MIQINIAKKKRSTTTFFGLDFNKFNKPAVLAAVILYFVPDLFLKDELAKERQQVSSQISDLKDKEKKLKKRLKGLSGLKEEIESFKIQTEMLKKRSVQVEKILQERTNPNKLLEKIARSIPEDLWFEEMNIKNGRIPINGFALSYKSVGLFLEKTRDSPFFNDRFVEETQDTINQRVGDDTIRLIKFRLGGPIVQYNPY